MIVRLRISFIGAIIGFSHVGIFSYFGKKIFLFCMRKAKK